MTSADILPLAVKSCVWLQCLNETIPVEEVLKAPKAACSQIPVKIGFLEDKFEIQIFKSENSYINVAVHRNRVNPNKKHDDGYALRFYTTVTGLDEESKVSIMKHDDEEAAPESSFKLSENIAAKINSTLYVFDIFVVAEMLEMKNIAEENEIKKNNDKYMSSCLGPRLTEKELRDLCFILKCSALKDVFTGRLPKAYTDEILYTIAFMAKNYAKVAEYLKARYKGKHSKTHNADISSILKYVDLEDDEQGPLSFEEACEKYHLAHKIGFDGMKLITSDYLLSFLDKDTDNILNILEVALSVHDEDLFDKVIFSFLKNFHTITRSKKFEFYSYQKAPIARLIIHSARLWVAKNNVYIPGWKPSAQFTAA